MTNDQIRDTFLANGFTIKPGHDDLKPYVYAAARALVRIALTNAQAECHDVSQLMEEASKGSLLTADGRSAYVSASAGAAACFERVSTLLAQLEPEPCPKAETMGEHVCANRGQCWEPCGVLGHDERFVQVVDISDPRVTGAVHKPYEGPLLRMDLTMEDMHHRGGR